jgi:hypothetical protein
MATFNKFDCFVENLAEKVHNLQSDSLTIELVAQGNAPTAGSTTVTPISYTNLATSRVLSSVTSTQSSGLYTLNAADMVLTASGAVATFRHVVLTNATASAGFKLIGWWDYGSDVTLANGETFTIDFTTGVLTIQ